MTLSGDALTPVARALEDVKDWIEQLSPHEPDACPEACCVVCDYIFALTAEIDQMVEDQL